MRAVQVWQQAHQNGSYVRICYHGCVRFHEGKPYPDKKTQVSEGVDEWRASGSDDVDTIEQKQHSDVQRESKEQALLDTITTFTRESEQRARVREHLKKGNNKPQEIRQHPKEDRAAARAAFRELMTVRYEGIGKIRTFLLESLRKEPDQDLESLLQDVLEIGSQHGLPKRQVEERARLFFSRYEKRRKLLLQKSDTQLLTSLGPSGQVISKLGLESLVRGAFNATIYTEKKPGGGFYLGGTGVTVNKSVPEGRMSVDTHEEQHVLTDLRGVETPEKRRDFSNLELNLSGAADELLAYAREGDAEYAGSYLLGGFQAILQDAPEERIYADAMRRNPYAKYFKYLTREEMQKYVEIVTRGADALRRLLKSMPTEEAIAILEQEPLPMWPKVARRVVDGLAQRKRDQLSDQRAESLRALIQKMRKE